MGFLEQQHNWGNRAKRLVAEFRADCGNRLDDQYLKTLIEVLSAKSHEFKKYWEDYGVMDREGGLRKFHHKKRGDLNFTQTTFYSATRRDLKIVLLLPT